LGDSVASRRRSWSTTALSLSSPARRWTHGHIAEASSFTSSDQASPSRTPAEDAPSYVVTDPSALRQAREQILDRVGDPAQLFVRHSDPAFASKLQQPLNPALFEVVQPASSAAAAELDTGGGAAASSAPDPSTLNLELQAVYLYDTFDRRVLRLVMGFGL
jgi:hypothetical protein